MESQKPNKVTNGICVLVNDETNVLGRIVEKLGVNTPINFVSDEGRTLNLDTKYYICDVPVRSYTFEMFAAESQEIKSEVLACLFCASKEQLTEEFLAKMSESTSFLPNVEVKALIIDNTSKPGTYNRDDLLTEIAIKRRIEIIPIEEQQVEEENLSGVPRIIEVIETILWPNLQRKPDPLMANKNRLRDYITAELAKVDGKSAKILSSKIELKEAPSDYPDADDEEAIMDWFDRPSQFDRNFTMLREGRIGRNSGLEDGFWQRKLRELEEERGDIANTNPLPLFNKCRITVADQSNFKQRSAIDNSFNERAVFNDRMFPSLPNNSNSAPEKAKEKTKK